MTVVLYGAIGVTFFLVAYELEVAAGWSALKPALRCCRRPCDAGAVGSIGPLAQRIGPRLN